MSITTEARSYADAAVEQGKTVINQAATAVNTANKRFVADAPKPAYAMVGAADLVVETVTKRVEALPSEAAANVAKAQETSKAAFAKAQDRAQTRLAELRSRVDARFESLKALPDTAPATAKSTGEAYVSTAKHVGESYLASVQGFYADLTKRGEAKLAELRKDPRISKLLGEASDVAETVQERVSPVVESVQSFFEPATESVPVKKAARKVSAAKASAAKAAPSTPRKSAPRKSAPRKTTPSA